MANFAERPAFEDAHVLDAFGGTGAPGIEAPSCGAAHATLVKKGRAVLAAPAAATSAHGVDDAGRCGTTDKSGQIGPAACPDTCRSDRLREPVPSIPVD